MAERRRAGRGRRTGCIAAGTAAVLVAAGAVTVWQTRATGATGYTTARSAAETIQQTESTSATVTPVRKSTAAFQVAGTVSKVDVTLGQHVTAGQKLATVDTTALAQNVSSARQALTADKAALSENEADEASTTGGSGTAGTTAAVTGGTGYTLTAATRPRPTTGTGTGTGTGTAGGLKAAQRAVVEAQQTADQASSKAAAALVQAERTCAASRTSPPTSTTTPPTTAAPTTTTTTTVPPTTSTSTSTTTTTTPTSTTTAATTAALTGLVRTPSTGSDACAQALDQALDQQQQLSTDQKTLATAENTLARILSSDAASTSGKGGSSGRPSSGGQSGGGSGSGRGTGTPGGRTGTGGTGATGSRTGSSYGGSRTGSSYGGSRTGSSYGGTGTGTASGHGAGTGSGARTSGTGTSGTRTGTGSGASSGAGVAYNSAQQLADDQAQIDTARAQLVTAEQALADATLTSPLAGTVAAIDLTAGQTVSANATSDAITIVNSSGYQATASLDDTEMAGIKVGDHVAVSVTGRTGTLDGTVSRLDPVQQTDGDYVYPVVVALSGVKGQISSGTTADLSIVLHSVSYALAVPTSAVHTAAAGDSYVEVLKDGKETEQPVTVGVVGGTYTQIRSGLTKGETVILANLSQPIPTATSGTTRGFGAGGRFGGGEFVARNGA